MNVYLIVAISSAVACVVLATVAAVVSLDNDSDQKTALKFCLSCIALALLGVIFLSLSEKHIKKQNELTRRDYKGSSIINTSITSQGNIVVQPAAEL